MNVTYEHKTAMTFIGFSTSIRPVGARCLPLCKL